MEAEAPSIRGTLTPNPAPMEADRRGIVYRVSHVVDGEFAELLRRNHSNPYHVAAEPGDLHNLASILVVEMMIGAFS